MDIISLDTIQLNAKAGSKEEAIKMAGELLVKAGHVTPSYIDGMLAREQTMSTYIGNGVAIPHGQFDDKESINSTGISVVQFLDGILWDEEDEDELAYLVIGIAATKDEHITVLTNLAEAIEEPDEARELTHTTDPNVIIERLNRPLEESD